MTPQPHPNTITRNLDATKSPAQIAADLTLFSAICLAKGRPGSMFYQAGRLWHWIQAVDYLATENAMLRAQLEREPVAWPVSEGVR